MTPCRRIGITLGDVAGIGPEVIYKALMDKRLDLDEVQFIIFGAPEILEITKEFLILKQERKNPFFFAEKLLPQISPKSSIPFKASDFGKTSSVFGRQAILWIEEAVTAFRKGYIDGLVTGPINKHSCHLGGFPFAGHTDFLAHLFGNPSHRMLFYSPALTVLLVTHHLSLKNSLNIISSQNIFESIQIGYEFLKKLKVKTPRIFIAAVNPHAGENGAFGDEEEKILVPSILQAEKAGFPVFGPFPPDTVFLKAKNDPNTLVVAMNHDQGLIPFKLLSFEKGVNVTAGLPLWRTSPDHGTAFDIAGKGMADESSMLEAIQLIIKLCGAPNSTCR